MRTLFLTRKSLLSFVVILFLISSVPVTFAVGPEVSVEPIPLDPEVRTEIEKYLGAGVLGKPVEPPIIEDPIAFMDLGPEYDFLVKMVHGEKKDQVHTVRSRRLERVGEDDDNAAWSLRVGEETWFGETTADGDFVQHSGSETGHGILVRYDPPQPIITKGMVPGSSNTTRINVQVSDLARPERSTYRGHLDLVHSYLGAYEVTVPAGRFEAALFEWKYSGKIGPANIRDVQYWFLAKNYGLIARIDKLHVSAFLIYQQRSRNAGVLVERR